MPQAQPLKKIFSYIEDIHNRTGGSESNASDSPIRGTITTDGNWLCFFERNGIEDNLVYEIDKVIINLNAMIADDVIAYHIASIENGIEIVEWTNEISDVQSEGLVLSGISGLHIKLYFKQTAGEIGKNFDWAVYYSSKKTL